jgi:hypothetical protein
MFPREPLGGCGLFLVVGGLRRQVVHVGLVYHIDAPAPHVGGEALAALVFAEV